MRAPLSVLLLSGLLGLLAVAPACSSTTEKRWELAQRTTWVLESLEGRPLEVPVEITLHLEQGRRIFGESGVNSYFGSFARDGERFATSRLASTRRAGPPDAMAQETRYLELLGEANRVRLDEPGLVLLAGDRVLLTFAPQR